MLDLVNEERRLAGLEPLVFERNLNETADDYSDEMLFFDRFDHAGIDGSSAGDRMDRAGFDFRPPWAWGENIAVVWGLDDSPLGDAVRYLHDALMDSPGHRANILDGGFELVGIGIREGEFRGYDGLMITQNFARTAGDVDLEGLPRGDRLVGGEGDDRIHGLGGDDRLVGGAGDDGLWGGSGNDRLVGGGGRDMLAGGSGRDDVSGGSGADGLLGGSGRDELNGGGGEDFLRGGSGPDELWGKAGADDMRGGSGDDRMSGAKGDDRLAGGSGDDAMRGGGGDDVLRGGSGDDWLRGGSGDDDLRGGSGADEFHFGARDGDDVIRDWEGGEDLIVITAGASRISDLDIRQRGDDAVIRYAGTEIVLEDVAATTLGPGDILFD